MLRSLDANGFPGDPVSLNALATSPGSKFTIGRNPDSNLLLEHPDFPALISRSHAEFVIVDGRLCVVDLGSTNGVYIDRRKLERAVLTEVYDGGKIYFGGTDKILKDGRPEQNPFAFVVHGVSALLHEARAAAAAARSPTAQDTQEAAPQLAPEPVAAALSHEQPQQQQCASQPPTVQAVPPQQQIPPHPQLAEQPAAGAPVAGPLASPAAGEQPAAPALPAPVAASQGPVDLTGTPGNITHSATAHARVNEIVDLTIDDDGGGSPLRQRLSFSQQLAGMPVSVTSSGLERARKRKEAALSLEVAEETVGPSGEGTSSGARAAAAPSSRSVLSKLEDDFECVVCQEMLVCAHTLVPCGHVFCGQCLMGWLHKAANCPNCRTDVTAPPVPALLINNMAEGLEGRLAPEDAAERERRKKHWKAVSGSAVATWNAMFAGGRATGARRAQQRGTDFFNRIGVQDVFLQWSIPRLEQGLVPPPVPPPAPPAHPPPPRGRPIPGRAGLRRSPRSQLAAAEARNARQRQLDGGAAMAVAEAALAPPAGGGAAQRAAPGAAGFQWGQHELVELQRIQEMLGMTHGVSVERRRASLERLRQAQEVRGLPRLPLRAPAAVEFGVGYHAGSRATCSGCEVLITPGTCRLHQSRRMPTGVMSTQYWHLHCYPSWETQRHTLFGIDALHPPDQADVQRRIMEARGGVLRQ